MRSRWMVMILFAASLLVSSNAFAHLSLQGPGYAGQSQVLAFHIGHGCEGADTVSLEIAIPEEVTSVRAMPNPFGSVEMDTDDTGAVTLVKWTNDNLRDVDEMYYEFSIRVKVPDAPFTTVVFPGTQVCRAADGTETTVEWAATPEEVAAAPAGEEPEPAPVLAIVPVRARGWNKFETTAEIMDLSIFDDAEIVWVGDAAYSANPTTMEMIEDEDGVEVLTEISAGSEIWVKY